MLTEATLGGVRPIGFRWGKARTYLLGSYVGFRGLRIIPLLRRCARSVHQRLGSDSHAHFRCLIASDWRGAPRRSSICIDRRYVLRSHATGADLNVASILASGKMGRLVLSAHSNVARLLDSCLARPAYGRVRDRTRRK